MERSRSHSARMERHSRKWIGWSAKSVAANEPSQPELPGSPMVKGTARSIDVVARRSDLIVGFRAIQPLPLSAHGVVAHAAPEFAFRNRAAQTIAVIAVVDPRQQEFHRLK